VTDISVLKSVKIGTHSVYLYNKEIHMYTISHRGRHKEKALLTTTSI